MTLCGICTILNSHDTKPCRVSPGVLPQTHAFSPACLSSCGDFLCPEAASPLTSHLLRHTVREQCESQSRVPPASFPPAPPQSSSNAWLSHFADENPDWLLHPQLCSRAALCSHPALCPPALGQPFLLAGFRSEMPLQQYSKNAAPGAVPELPAAPAGTLSSLQSPGIATVTLGLTVGPLWPAVERLSTAAQSCCKRAWWRSC